MIDEIKHNDGGESMETEFFGESSIIRIMQKLHVSTSFPTSNLLEMVSSICRLMVSENGREVFSKYFQRNGALALRMRLQYAPTANFILKFCEYDGPNKTEDPEFRMYFIYLSYCILRGHIGIDNLQRTSWEDIPTFEEWYEKITNSNLNYLYPEESLLDDIVRLTKYTAKGRISKVPTHGILDQSFREETT